MNTEAMPAQGPVDVTVGRPAMYLAFSDNGENIRFWTSSEGHAREWARENWETEQFYSGAQMALAAAEIARLRKICMTAKEALYLGTKDDLEVADMLEAALLTPNAK